MQFIGDVSALRAWRKQAGKLALVPTMGNLHAGHLSLVELARQRGDAVVVSIFVNRLQFEPGGDFDRYPRTIERDCDLLRNAGAHAVFAPDERELYPVPAQVFVEPPPSAEQLCGSFRPGHFRGVCTVVAKLFNVVQPDVAVFGRKDYQQLFVIREMTRDLNFPIDIVAGETVREGDGLAMSSRNGYLSREERVEAVRLVRNLQHIRSVLQQEPAEFERLEREAVGDLTRHGWKVDYIALRSQATLQPPQAHERDVVVLGAAYLGKTRLIDNLEFTRAV